MIQKIRIGHDGKGWACGWHLDKVEVRRLKDCGKVNPILNSHSIIFKYKRINLKSKALQHRNPVDFLFSYFFILFYDIFWLLNLELFWFLQDLLIPRTILSHAINIKMTEISWIV